MASKLLILFLFLSLHTTALRSEYLDACSAAGPDFNTIERVIQSALFRPEGNPETDFTPSTVYINCFGNSRVPGKYSTISATLDFDLNGDLKYTREDFTCVDNQWRPVGIADQYFDPDDTPIETRNSSFFKIGCAKCNTTDAPNYVECEECSQECNQTVHGYPTCFRPGIEGCCHYLVNDKCVSSCPPRYATSPLNTSLCVCANHWTGDDCLTCPLFCLHGGSVQEGCAGCSCAQGYTGETCETEIDYCTPQPCLYNGTCTYDRYGYNCTCAPGFTGPNCATEIDFCSPYPCFNFAVCENSRFGFSCRCHEGTSGQLCEYRDYCHSNPCQNNGACANTNVSEPEPQYLCACSPGYLGDNCEITDHCYNDMCKNSGQCINLANGYECNCTVAFYGPQCEYEVTPCAPNPCRNYGICDVDNSPDGFSCKCQRAFTGPTCEEEIDHCENVTCRHNGTCSNEFFGFLCTCEAGFRGLLCEEEVDYCATSPCQNSGVCSYDRLGYNCTCPAGFRGVNCSEIVQFCSPNPCQNNATCHSSPTGYNCTCVLGYRGDVCQEKIDYCSPPPCDRGECVQGTGGYTCVCDVGYTGVNCSEIIDSCSEGVCLNGGKCIQLEGNFTCECQEPFSGRQCERIDPEKVCKNVSCLNGGRCNRTSLREADQSELRKVLEGESVVGGAAPCDCAGRWEGSYCDRCPICENPNVDCQQCECKGLWSGPDCADCSGHTTSEGQCSDTADTPSDTTNIIPIVIPILLAGLGGLGSIPCIACLSCKCKKWCKQRRKPIINVHVIHRDLEKNGSGKSNKRDKTKVSDEVSDRLQHLTGELEDSSTHSVVSALSSSGKSKHSTEPPGSLASGVYDRLPPVAESHRPSGAGPVRFISQNSGGYRSKLRSPRASIPPDESELRLISSSDNSQTGEEQGYSNHSDSSFTLKKL